MVSSRYKSLGISLTWRVSPRIGLRGFRKFPEVRFMALMKHATTFFILSRGSWDLAARGINMWNILFGERVINGMIQP